MLLLFKKKTALTDEAGVLTLAAETWGMQLSSSHTSIWERCSPG